MKNWFCVVALSLVVGCGTAVVRPYIGEQQAWPVASGSIVNTRYDMPVFTSLPPSTYAVLGELRYDCWYKALPEESDLPQLIDKARKLNADALLFVQGEVFFATNYGPKPGDEAALPPGGIPTLTQVNRFNPDSFRPGVTILAIKWTHEPPPGLEKKKKKGEQTEAANKQTPAPQAPAPAPAPAPPEAPAAEAPAATPAPAPAEAAPAAEPAPAAMESTPAEPPPAPPADTNATPGKIQFR